MPACVLHRDAIVASGVMDVEGELVLPELCTALSGGK